MKLYSLLVSLVLLALVGCGSENSETTGPIPASANKPASPATQLPFDTNALKASQATPATSTGAAALNPPHGQPGHRCDIEVGKPLNSAPIQTSISPQPQQINTLPQPVNPPSGTGLNPPHGQPGHRCDIAVGAPLK